MLDPRPARKDLLTSREVAKILGGVLEGLSRSFGREAVRAALSCDQIPFASHDVLRSARVIGAFVTAAEEVSNYDTIEEAIKFWLGDAARIDALPDKDQQRGSSS